MDNTQPPSYELLNEAPPAYSFLSQENYYEARIRIREQEQQKMMDNWIKQEAEQMRNNRFNKMRRERNKK